MIWLVMAAASALIFGVLLWLVFGGQEDERWDRVLRQIREGDRQWMDMSKKARERHWRENSDADKSGRP